MLNTDGTKREGDSGPETGMSVWVGEKTKGTTSPKGKHEGKKQRRNANVSGTRHADVKMPKKSTESKGTVCKN